MCSIKHAIFFIDLLVISVSTDDKNLPPLMSKSQLSLMILKDKTVLRILFYEGILWITLKLITLQSYTGSGHY